MLHHTEILHAAELRRLNMCELDCREMFLCQRTTEKVQIQKAFTILGLLFYLLGALTWTTPPRNYGLAIRTIYCGHDPQLASL